MRTCDEFRVGLSAYLDGEAGDQEEAIRAHVEGCGACQRILGDFRHASGQIRAIAEDEPATLVENIRGRVREGDARRRGRIPIPRLAAAAMLLAALLWTVVLLGNGGAQTVRLSDLARGSGLSEAEQRVLYGDPPADDEWMVIVLSGGSPR